MGDWNATLGPRQGQEIYVGPHAEDVRNEAGDRLAAFLEAERLFATNSFFNKKSSRRWTHINPSGTSKREIDYILTNRRVATDVGTISSFSTGSDHRLLRAKLFLSLPRVKSELAFSRRPPPHNP